MVLRDRGLRRLLVGGQVTLGTAADLRDPFSSRGTDNVPQGSYPREKIFIKQRAFCLL